MCVRKREFVCVCVRESVCRCLCARERERERERERGRERGREMTTGCGCWCVFERERERERERKKEKERDDNWESCQDLVQVLYPPRARGGGLCPSQLSSPAAPAVSSASGARRARRASSPPVVLVAGRRVVLLRLMPVRRKPVAWVRCRRSTPRSVRPTRALGALSERDGRTLPLPLPCSPCCSRAAWRAVRPPVDKVPQGTKGHGASGAPHGPRSACVGARPYAGARRTVQTNRTNIPYHTAPVPDPPASSPPVGLVLVMVPKRCGSVHVHTRILLLYNNSR